MLKLSRVALALSLVAGLVGSSYAQQTITKKLQLPDRPKVAPTEKQEQPQLRNRTQDQNRTETQQADKSSAHRGAIDHYSAACAINQNENEVAISKLAAQKATNPEVKAFAEMLVKDHTAFIEKVRPFEAGGKQAAATGEPRIRGGLGLRRGVAEDGAANQDQPLRERVAQIRKDAAAGNEDQPSRVGDARPANPRTEQDQAQADRDQKNPQAGHMDRGQGHIPVQTLIQVSDEIAKRCLASAQRELNAKQSDEFDKCYIGMQIGHHTMMVDTLSVVQNHVSPELRQVFSDGLETSQRHLTEAKRIMELLDKGSAQTAAGEKKRQ